MKKIALQGLSQHAPANTRPAILASYVAGAHGCLLDIQMTKDKKLVVIHKSSLNGKPIESINYANLQDYDMSQGYQPSGSENFRYFHDSRYKLRVELLSDLLTILPKKWMLIFTLPMQSINLSDLIQELFSLLHKTGFLAVSYISCSNHNTVNIIQSKTQHTQILIDDREIGIEEQINIVKKSNLNGIITKRSNIIGTSEELTIYGEALSQLKERRPEFLGAIIRDLSEDLSRANFHGIVNGVLIDSMNQLNDCFDSWTQIEESFSGKKIDTHHWSFGYAKANPYCHVYQDDGIHIAIKPFTKPVPEIPDDETLKRLLELERLMQYALKTWEWYSGGGAGLRLGITNDFVAEVEYETERTGQNITLEMAAVNVDPGFHQRPWNQDGSPRYPRSNNNKDSFYDPHGAPPYIGVEHDEDDGYRINWNFGSDYDNNGYGSPVGDGKTPRKGKLMFARRGSYFAAYYRNEIDAPNWVCCGVQRNDSLNRTVFLRFVGKRWGRHKPDENVEFVFRNVKVQGICHTDNSSALAIIREENYVNQ